MKFMLDTNVITAILKGNEETTKLAEKKTIAGDEVVINGMAYYEIKRGLLASNATNQLRQFQTICRIYSLIWLESQNIFDIASEIYASLKRRGEPIGDADILIASMALCNNAILVSADTDFNRIKDLKVENWLEEC